MRSGNIFKKLFSCFQRKKDIEDEKNEDKKVYGWNPYLIFVCVTTTIGTAMPIGYNLGVLNTLVMFIKSWSHDSILKTYKTDLSDTELDALWASYIAVIAAGAIPGSMIGGWCANKFGRKKAVLTGSFINAIAVIFIFFARSAGSVEMFLAGRCLCGIATGILFSTFPAYLMEITPTELTGTVGVYLSIGLCCGIILGQVISLPLVLGTEEHWNYAVASSIILDAGSLVLSFWYPESPLWLFQIKRNEELAYDELKRLRGSNSEQRIKQEMAEMRATSKAEGEMDKTGYMTVLRDRTLWLPLLLVLILNSGVHLSGLSVVMVYSAQILTKAGFTLEQIGWINVGCSVLNVGVSMCGPYLMGNFNRRTLTTFSTIQCGCSLLIFTISLSFIDEADWVPFVAIIFQCLFMISFPLGFGTIATFIASELFEVEPRSVAMSIGSLSTWIGNIFISMSFPLLLNAIGYNAFLPCIAVASFVGVFSWFYLPETRGHSPSEVKPLMANGLRSRVRNSNRPGLIAGES